MVREAYQLSLPRAVYAAYLVARAEIAFAPFPNNDPEKAVAYIQRLFRSLNGIHGLPRDPAEAARLEVVWWGVHRQLFAREENPPLVTALAKAWESFYGVSGALLQPAASHRALGMLYSDRWVNSGRPLNSLLLQMEEDELAQGYRALKEALQPPAG
jgi:hypothetical protein